jgi:hypothetical protein
MSYDLIRRTVPACSTMAQVGTIRRAHLEHDTIGQRCATWLHREFVRLCRRKQLCTRLLKVIAVIQTLMLPVSALSSRDALSVGQFGVARVIHAG